MARVQWAEPVDPARAALMGRVRQHGTAAELALRAAVTRHGARFRCNVRTIPGWPDISNQRARVAVFVDGCFWHGCPIHFRLPKTRTEYWRAKIARNRAKRADVRARLSGWNVFEFYECDIKKEAHEIGHRIARAMLPSSP